MNACIRFIFNLRKDEHVSRFYNTLGWLPTDDRRVYLICCLVFTILNSGIPPYLASNLRPRSCSRGTLRASSHDLVIPPYRTTAFQQFFQYIAMEWRTFAHVTIDHQPLTALEQWKASRHWLLWVAMVNRNVGKRNILATSLWNSLPLAIKQAKSLNSFKHVLFCHLRRGVPWYVSRFSPDDSYSLSHPRSFLLSDRHRVPAHSILNNIWRFSLSLSFKIHLLSSYSLHIFCCHYLIDVLWFLPFSRLSSLFFIFYIFFCFSFFNFLIL